jgi:hypothetical protein
MGDPTSNYTTTSIALRVSGALKPHHHDKVETPSVVPFESRLGKKKKGKVILVTGNGGP